ncbi:lytic transglycosylase domain-containing protein [Sphingomonas sp.]|uniref:lytic transglycosylase domain-containing protein n=1 Tax=Sphingomonas sp. TaxID=28214 RepID=UPI0035BBE300
MTISSISTARVQSAIVAASSRTGVDFNYLLGQAKLESGLRANAKAARSSASGLYQFIESSWLAVVKKHGAEHGLGWAADAIGPGNRVVDASTRQAILALRNDPAAASLMAAEHASDNKDALQATLGRDATGTDLYMAHFLGLGGAKKFLTKMAASPNASGAALFPQAASANKGVFYAKNGQPRSLTQIYDRFADKLAGSDAAGTASANRDFATRVLGLNGDTTVVTGSESAEDALSWASSTIGQLDKRKSVDLLRPTPNTARLAYMMLAGL